MIYRFKHSNYDDFNVYKHNKMRRRAYFIPYSDKKSIEKVNYLEERYKSSRVQMLNGEWDFAYYKTVSDLGYEIDTDTVKFDNVKVPSMWQHTGYEEPCYINSRYEFPVNPPAIVKNVPVGMYRKKFAVIKSDECIITFLGVCSSLELYVNGRYVGYSEGSHNSAEFNITDFLTEGDNELVALVYKFCNGSYLEAQDMFRSQGIFRDVYLTYRAKSHIDDFYFKTVHKGGADYELECTLLTGADKARITLQKDGKIIGKLEQSSGLPYIFNVKNAEEWSAEIPNLYTAFIELTDGSSVTECVRQEIGFKNIKIDGNVFKFNGKKLTLLGVNRHDTNPKTGYYMSTDDNLKDVLLMKELNINCIRTSHYPPDPILLKMCNYAGLYVVDEADIETHGCGAVHNDNLISNDLSWEKHYIDRVLRMYERDKNNTCVTMWSLGNESGGIKCQDACYRELKKITEIPVHYEGAIRSARNSYDVISTMYKSTQFFDRYLAGRAPKKYYAKPYYQCEYAHAMGLGAGSLENYVKAYLNADGLLGGCIWEWADHAIYHENDKYPYQYTYGGDHGERIHDSNFCADGIVYPDRSLSTTAYNVRTVYRPLRSDLDGRRLTVKNHYSFKSSDGITAEYYYVADGTLTDTKKIELKISPLASESYILEKSPEGVNVYMNIIYRAENGNELGREKYTLKESAVLPALVRGKVASADNNAYIDCEFNGGKVRFSKATGAIVSYKYNGVQCINTMPCNKSGLQGLIPALYRAPIDNYMHIDRSHKRKGLNAIEYNLKRLNYSENTVTAVIGLSMKGINKIDCKLIYTVGSSGEIDVKLTYKNRMPLIYDLPKCGATLEMPAQMNRIKYFGLGPLENYPDFHEHSLPGVYECTAEQMADNYIKPQESGNRGGTHWASVTNEKGEGLLFSAQDTLLNFNASRTTLDTLCKARHREDVIKEATVAVNLDGYTKGCGSHSCGPKPRAEYNVKLKPFSTLSYRFRISPLGGK